MMTEMVSYFRVRWFQNRVLLFASVRRRQTSKLFYCTHLPPISGFQLKTNVVLIRISHLIPDYIIFTIKFIASYVFSLFSYTTIRHYLFICLNINCVLHYRNTVFHFGKPYYSVQLVMQENHDSLSHSTFYPEQSTAVAL